MSSRFQPQYSTDSSVDPMVQRIWAASAPSSHGPTSTVCSSQAPPGSASPDGFSQTVVHSTPSVDTEMLARS